MIFVTVGTQLAFDRLVDTVDQWALSHPDTELFAQIGPSASKPRNIKSASFVTPDVADELFQRAEFIVSHAGMGSILTALKYRKPILIMPRRANLGEHRNDHQLATAKWLGAKAGVQVAWDEASLVALLDQRKSFQGGAGISEFASPDLIKNLHTFIHS